MKLCTTHVLRLENNIIIIYPGRFPVMAAHLVHNDVYMWGNDD